jgi:hypothetical protein
MRGRQFLELAREIIKGGSERHRRGAAGRAYYALLLECRDALDAWGFPAPRRDAVHTFVRQRFNSTANADLRAIYDVLDPVSTVRSRADYELSGTFLTTGQVQQVTNDVTKALQVLDDTNADAARRSAAVADIKARWP